MMFEFKGTMKLRGVFFLVEAPSLNEAKQKALKGEFDDTEESGAEMYGWEVFENTGKQVDL